MHVQRIQNNNYNAQFKGSLKLEIFGNNAGNCKKQISQATDKILYDTFLELLGEKPKVHATISGTKFISYNKRSAFNKFLNTIDKTFNTELSKYKTPNESFIYSYNNDVKGEMSYQIKLNDSYLVEHKFTNR